MSTTEYGFYENHKHGKNIYTRAFTKTTLAENLGDIQSFLRKDRCKR
ncbi:hypothetical protein [Succinivibrio sp.]|nr:hypothetical protein [Succinivibrio sp.]MBQ9220262.1 hypothetical protein [Succinivibrio sp.]